MIRIGIVDDRAARTGRAGIPNRQQIVAVLGCTLRKIEPRDGRKRRHEIDLAQQRGALFAVRDDSGPAHDEGHAVSAFPEVTLQTAQWSGTAMLVVADAIVGVTLRSIVSRKDHDGVLPESVRLERLQYSPDRVVRLHHKITIAA